MPKTSIISVGTQLTMSMGKSLILIITMLLMLVPTADRLPFTIVSLGSGPALLNPFKGLLDNIEIGMCKGVCKSGHTCLVLGLNT
jgi:hypothetical protein